MVYGRDDGPARTGPARMTHGDRMARLLSLLLLLALSAAAGADIYKWRDANGGIHFGDDAGRQPAATAEKVTVRVNTYTHVSYEKLKAAVARRPGAERQVTLYGTSWCGYCKRARAWLSARNIRFADLDIETDPAAKAQFDSLHAHGVPVVLVDDTRINGFDEDTYARLIKGS